MNTVYHIKARTYEEFLEKKEMMLQTEDAALCCASLEWEKEETYYLLKSTFYGSLGGCEKDLDIVCIFLDRDEVVKTVKQFIENGKYPKIESINGCDFEDFEFDDSCNMWEIRYAVDGLTVNNDTLLKIVCK